MHFCGLANSPRQLPPRVPRVELCSLCRARAPLAAQASVAMLCVGIDGMCMYARVVQASSYARMSEHSHAGTGVKAVCTHLHVAHFNHALLASASSLLWLLSCFLGAYSLSLYIV